MNAVVMKLEVVILPVGDAERSKRFYAGLGLETRCRHRRGR